MIALIYVVFFFISGPQKVPVSTVRRETTFNGFDSSGNVDVQSEKNLNRTRTEGMDIKVPENGTSKVDKVHATSYYEEGK